jgi:hypothetical protein
VFIDDESELANDGAPASLSWLDRHISTRDDGGVDDAHRPRIALLPPRLMGRRLPDQGGRATLYRVLDKTPAVTAWHFPRPTPAGSR